MKAAAALSGRGAVLMGCRLGEHPWWLLSCHPQTDITTVCRAPPSAGCPPPASGQPLQGQMIWYDIWYDMCKGCWLEQDEKNPTQGLCLEYISSLLPFTPLKMGESLVLEFLGWWRGGRFGRRKTQRQLIAFLERKQGVNGRSNGNMSNYMKHRTGPEICNDLKNSVLSVD